MSTTEQGPSARRIKAVRRRKRGMLAKLIDLPLDVLDEIFGYVHPLDLLFLSWTTKAFWKILMTRRAAPIWRHALLQVKGMPECPFDMIEPAYARLAFYARCDSCATTVSKFKSVYWACRVRCCVKCFASSFEPCSVPPGYYDWPDVARDAYMMCLPIAERQYCGHFLINHRDFLEQMIERMVDEPATLATYLDEEQIHTQLREEHAEKCVAWFEDLEAEQELQKDAMRARRFQQIVEKLIELGWGDVLERLVRDGSVVSYFPDWVDIKEVDQPKELTDRIWANISQTVIDSVTHDLEILEYLEGLHNTAHA